MHIINKKLFWVNITILLFLGIYFAVTAYIIASKFSNIELAIRREDLMQAVQKVDDQEKVIINQKIAEIKKDTVKRVLSPLVVERH